MKNLTYILFAILCITRSHAQNTIDLSLKVNTKTLPNIKNFGVRGNMPPLSWENTFILKDDNKDGIFEGKVSISSEENTVLEYKFVYGDKNVIYEDGSNRIFTLSKGTTTLSQEWNVPSSINISALPKLTKTQLLEDFKIAKNALKTVHPGLYRYNTEKQIDSIFNHFETVFSEPMSYQSAFLNFTKVTESLKCGHTFPNFFNQSGFLQQVVLDQADKLPFTFRIVDNRMIVMANASENQNLNDYREVLTINGIPVETILMELSKLVKADGSNDSKRMADLNTFGIGSYEMFDAYFPLLYQPINGNFGLTLTNPTTKEVKEVSVEAMSRTQRMEAIKMKYPKYPSSTDDLWKLEFWEDETAYLKLGTFDVFQLTFEWDKFLKSAFKEINKKKSKHLVIDIRWNEGGQDEVLFMLGQFLAKKPISLVNRKDLVAYAKIPESLKPYLFTWNNDFYDLTEKVLQEDSKYFRFKDKEDISIKPISNAFSGEVFVLINAANSSSTFYFAELIKKNQMATLIGETTGSSQKGLNGGQIFFLRLPNSKIEIDIPIIGAFST